MTKKANSCRGYGYKCGFRISGSGVGGGVGGRQGSKSIKSEFVLMILSDFS